MGQGESLEGFYDKPKSIPDSDQFFASRSQLKAPPLQMFLQIPSTSFFAASLPSPFFLFSHLPSKNRAGKYQ
jgi:hypothetical protein